MNNSIFVMILTLFTVCLYLFNTNMIEGFVSNISGTSANHAYSPPERRQQNRNIKPVVNYSPHGTGNMQNSSNMETYNYKPKNVIKQFNNIEQFKKTQTKSQPNKHNTRSPQKLPRGTMKQTFIPPRENYQANTQNNITSITPRGFRNGARPLSGAGLLRGEVSIEPYTGTTIQLGTPK